MPLGEVRSGGTRLQRLSILRTGEYPRTSLSASPSPCQMTSTGYTWRREGTDSHAGPTGRIQGVHGLPMQEQEPPCQVRVLPQSWRQFSDTGL